MPHPTDQPRPWLHNMCTIGDHPGCPGDAAPQGCECVCHESDGGQPATGAPTNPVICRILAALRVLGVDGPATAADVLDAAPAHLSDREYAQVLGWTGLTRTRCRGCNRILEFVTAGPQPGWWSHRAPGPAPCAAVPVIPESVTR
jgi:hypothetical protein